MSLPSSPPAEPGQPDPSVEGARLHHDPALVIDRDLAGFAFQRRVFEEALDERNPLLERVRFLAILGSNVDEFAMSRGAELVRRSRGSTLPMEGVPPGVHEAAVRAAAGALLEEARQHLHERLVPALAEAGIHLTAWTDLGRDEREDVGRVFGDAILPLLMPLGFDTARPFPHVTGRDLIMAVRLRDGSRERRLAILRLPPGVSAFVPFRLRRPSGATASGPGLLQQGLVRLEEVVLANLGAIFPGVEVIDAHPFRLLRDAELAIDDDADRARAVADALRRREFGDVVAMIVAEDMPVDLVDLLAARLGVPPGGVHRTRQFTVLRRLHDLAGLDRPDLHFPPFEPRRPAEAAPARGAESLFDRIRRGDILLHHPFESFEPVVELLREAARDPHVAAISISLYRVGRDSPVVAALLDARRAGKDVRVVVELRARFDEANNLDWAAALAREGAHVAYGVPGLKVHAKLALVVRREGSRIARYVHVSSGNFNTATARLYTDVTLLTCNEEVGRDAGELFNFLSGYGAPAHLRRLVAAPFGLEAAVHDLLREAAAAARQGRPAHLILKMNALVDRGVIGRCYEASRAGVEIDLLVRGACCLRPGLPGISDRIRVRSIVGRFLEHSRIWYAKLGAEERAWIGSADLMPRNLRERVEVMAPLRDPAHVRRIREEILQAYLDDTAKARTMESDGSYRRPAAVEPARSSQDELLARAGA